MTSNLFAYIILLLAFGIRISTAQTITMSDSIVTQNGIKYYIHKVEKKQTLYSISRLYQTTVDVIKTTNELTSEALSENQYLKIPFTKAVAVKTYTIPTGKKPANSKTPATYVPIAVNPEFNISTNDDEYNIAILLPLYLKDNLSLSFNSEDELRHISMIKPFNFIGFLEGALMAIDSAKKQGRKIHVTILDEVEDTNAVKSYFKEPEMQYIDLLIGPFFNNSISIAARYIKQNNIKSNRKTYMLAPLLYNAELIKTNPYIIKPTPAVDLQITQLAAFTVKDTSKSNHFTITTKDPNDQKHSKLFKSLCLKPIQNPAFILKDIYWDNNPNIWNTFKNHLNPDVPNNIYMFSNSEAFTSSIIRKIIVDYKDYQIILHGLPTWQNFESIEPYMLQQLNTHIFSSSYINYESKNTQQFINNFNSKYHFFPDKYAFQGFDITWIIVNNEQKAIEKMLPLSPKTTIEGLQSSYSFNKKDGMGFENTYITIFKYADYKTIKIN